MICWMEWTNVQRDRISPHSTLSPTGAAAQKGEGGEGEAKKRRQKQKKEVKDERVDREKNNHNMAITHLIVLFVYSLRYGSPKINQT